MRSVDYRGLPASFLLVCVIVALSSCDMLGLNGDDPPPQRTISVRTESPAGTLVNGRITFGGTTVDDDGTADSTAVQSEESVTIAATASGRLPADTTVSWNQNHDIMLILPEDNPENVSVPVSATATDADTAVASDYYLVREARDDSLLAEDRKETVVVLPFQEEPVTIRAEAEYFASGTDQLQLDSDNPSAEIGLDRELVPVTLAAFAAGPDSMVVADYYDGDSRVAKAQKEASVILDYRPEPTELKAQATYFKTASKKLQPAANQRIEFGLERKSVELTITPKRTNGVVLDSAESRISWRSNSMTVFGDTTVVLPMGEGQRTVRTTLITEHPERSEDLLRYDPQNKKVSADESVTLTVIMERLLGCDDGITNDGDDLVDADDPGCWNQQGEYTPDDDNEGHVFAQYIGISGGEGAEGTNVVSSAESQREFYYPDTDRVIRIREAIMHAVDVGVTVETERDSTQADETFAAKLKCGPSDNNLDNTNTSGIVPDNQQQYGWGFTPIPGIETYFFATGGNCRIIWQHGTLVRGEPTGDGNDDVFFLKPDDTQRSLVISYFVQEEDFGNDKSQALTQAGDKKCQLTGYGKTCRKVVSDGLGSRFLRR